MMWLFSSVLLLFPSWSLGPFCKAACPLRPRGGTWERSDGNAQMGPGVPAGSSKWWCGLWKKAAFLSLTSVIPGARI